MDDKLFLVYRAQLPSLGKCTLRLGTYGIERLMIALYQGDIRLFDISSNVLSSRYKLQPYEFCFDSDNLSHIEDELYALNIFQRTGKIMIEDGKFYPVWELKLSNLLVVKA